MGERRADALFGPDGTSGPSEPVDSTLPPFELPPLDLPTIGPDRQVRGVAGGDDPLDDPLDDPGSMPAAGTVAWLVAQRARAGDPIGAPPAGGSATEAPGARRPHDAPAAAPDPDASATPPTGAPGLDARRARARGSAAGSGTDPSPPGSTSAEPDTAGSDAARPASAGLRAAKPGAAASDIVTSDTATSDIATFDTATSDLGGPAAAGSATSTRAASRAGDRAGSRPTLGRPPAQPDDSRRRPGAVPPTEDAGVPVVHPVVDAGPTVNGHRPPIEPEPGILGLSRHTRGKLGARLFTWFFVGIFTLILVQLVVSLLTY